MVDLLEHNKIAYEKVKSAIADGKKKIAISHATGTGKSYLIAKLFEDYSNDKKLVLVPSRYIKEQIEKLFEKYDIGNADIILYQKLIKMSDEDIAAMDYQIIVLDEYHHDTSKVWGGKVKTLIESHTDSIIFGTTATPIRSDGINVLDELFEGNCVSELPLSTAIAKKILPLPVYVGALYTLNDELERLREKVKNATNTKEEKQEFYKKINTMRSQIEKSYGMPIILNKNIKDREGKYLVFCKNKKHLAEIKDIVIEWFKIAGFKDINAYVVHSSYENKDAEYKAFCEDTSHNLNLLFSIDLLNEGLHLENISGVLLLRPTRSSIVWHQQIGRAIEANNTNIPVIIDAVNNFSSIGQGMELLRGIKDAIAKEKESDSNFDDSAFEDIDTFFVLEQILEIQEMFREIEDRLRDHWDAMFQEYCKFYKENKHGDVPKTKKYKRLAKWCYDQRNNLNNNMLPEYRKNLLDDNEFIWNVHQYRFKNKINDLNRFVLENNRYPTARSSDKHERSLAYFLCDERHKKRDEKIAFYPQWKLDIVKQAGLDDFFDDRFDKFYKYLIRYQERNGDCHNIKAKEIIDGYNLGFIYHNMLKDFRNGKMSDEQVNRLLKMGIDFSKSIYQKKTNIIDENGKVYTYSSKSEAGRSLYNDFHIVDSEKQGINIITNRILGNTKTSAFKGFRFEYVD